MSLWRRVGWTLPRCGLCSAWQHLPRFVRQRPFVTITSLRDRAPTRLQPQLTRQQHSVPSPAPPPPPTATDDVESSSSSTSPPPLLLHYVMTIEYDGTAFHGSSGLNTGHLTVQSALTAAIQKVTRTTNVDLILAGRTDADVHALGQVAHFSLPSPDPSSHLTPRLHSPRLLFLINQALYHLDHSPHLHVLTLSRISPLFHARFSALSRHYLYRILTGSPSVFQRNRAWWTPHHLNLPLMQHAASLLIGPHNFASLVSHRPTDRRSTHRTITSLTVREREEGEGRTRVVEVEVEAPSFLHHQVRNVVAVLVEVGKGRLKAEEVTRLLQGRERRWNPIGSAPGYGLYLKGVRYDEVKMKEWTIPVEEELSVEGEGIVEGVIEGAARKRVRSDDGWMDRADAVVWQANDGAEEYLWKRVKNKPRIDID